MITTSNKISFALSITHKNNLKSISITDFLEAVRTGIFQGKDYKPLFEKIRKIDVKKETDTLKKSLPYTTLSGTFKNRFDNDLIQHSGLMQGDIDPKDNPNIDIHKLKMLLAKDRFIYAVFISPSGKGLKLIIKVPPVVEHHKAYYDAIAAYLLSNYKIVIDKSCHNLSRAFYLSYDPEIFINLESAIFDKMLKSENHPIINNKPVQANKSANNEIITDKEKIRLNVESCLNQIKTAQIDITNNYQDWFKIGAALANEFGEEGREYFHIVSQFNSNYNHKETDDKFTDCLNGANKVTIRSFFHFCKQYGISFKNTDTSQGKIRQNKPITAPTNNDNLKNSSKPVPDENNTPKGTKKYTPAPFIFWAYDEKQGLIIDRSNYLDFLQDNGYYKIYLEEVIFIHIENNICVQVEPTAIKDFVIKYIESLKDEQIGYGCTAKDLKNTILKAVNIYFSTGLLECVKTKEISFLKDTKDEAFIYFKNCFVKVTKNDITTHNYNELKGTIWKKQILDRVFTVEEIEDCEFMQFLYKVCNSDNNRYQSLANTLGYLLHSYKNPALTKVVILVDEKADRTGGTGKSMVIEAVTYFKKTAQEGKTWNMASNFAFQKVELDTQLFWIDDSSYDLDFGQLFTIVTNGFAIEKKGKASFTIPFENSPKIAITTNFTFKGEGNQFERRQHIVEISPYYNKDFTPLQDFGHLLFKEWQSSEWNKFDNFMITCLKQYLNNQTLVQIKVNYDERKLIDNTSEEFVELMERLSWNQEHDVNSLYGTFLTENSDWKTLKEKHFRNWIKKYVELRKINTLGIVKDNPHKPFTRVHGKYFINFFGEKANIEDTENVF